MKENNFTYQDIFTLAVIHAPMPLEQYITMEQQIDNTKNPYNDSHKPKLRDRNQIIADLKVKYAKCVLEAIRKANQYIE